MNLIKINLNIFLTFILLFLGLMLIQSIFNPLFVWKELVFHFETFDLRGLAKGSVYLASYLFAVLSYFIIISLKSNRFFIGVLVLLWILLSADIFVQLLGVTHGFSLAEYALSLNEVGNYKYLFAYMDKILKAMFISLFFILFLYFLRTKVLQTRISNKYFMFILVSIMFIFGVCHKIDTMKLSSYPIGLKFPAIMLEHFGNSAPMIRRVLNKKIQPKGKGEFKNIVWIIDESVAGTYLSINGYDKETTPYLKELDKISDKISNFGVVNSISNCSAQSNLFLRIGMNPSSAKDVTKEFRTLPTIFQYAKRAGYKTWLMDSQTRKDHLQNYLTPYDRESIDHFETLGAEVTRVDRDKIFLKKLQNILNNRENKDKNFIVLVKYGAHFPYLLTYDNEEDTIFKPVLDVSYGGMDMEHKEQQINTYANSIYFNTDLYLKEMLKNINLNKNIIFYTSDHGQNILEVPSITRTHCNNDVVVKNEVSVPLMVFCNSAKEKFSVDKNLFYSQIQIFPTTLKLFGYDKKLVDSYGKTLDKGFNHSDDRKYILSSSFSFKIFK